MFTATRKNSPTISQVKSMQRMRLAGATLTFIGDMIGFTAPTVRSYCAGISHPFNHGERLKDGTRRVGGKV